MTRFREMYLEDLFGCDHTPETPVVEDGEIIEWRCRCGRRLPPVEIAVEKKEPVK